MSGTPLVTGADRGESDWLLRRVRVPFWDATELARAMVKASRHGFPRPWERGRVVSVVKGVSPRAISHLGEPRRPSGFKWMKAIKQ